MATGNEEQIEYWNGRAGQTWVEAHHHLDRLLAPISAALLERAAARNSERAIDVGCGCGGTTLALATHGAHVWGIDISAPMLEEAAARAAGLENVRFSRADAAAHPFSPEHDLLLSRFGIMFFSDPYAAFTNLRTALRPEGRLCFVCWQQPRANAWIALAGSAVQPFLPAPEAQADPRAPGPFAFADPDYLRDILTHAGFDDVDIAPLTPTLHVADSLDEAVYFMQKIGPLARALAELDADTAREAEHAVRRVLGEHVTDSGLDLGAACWLVHARAAR